MLHGHLRGVLHRTLPACYTAHCAAYYTAHCAAGSGQRPIWDLAEGSSRGRVLDGLSATVPKRPGRAVKRRAKVENVKK